MEPKKINKYLYLHVIQGNYGFGWEDIDAGSYREMRTDLKLYRQEEPEYPHRMIKRREINPEWKVNNAN